MGRAVVAAILTSVAVVPAEAVGAAALSSATDGQRPPGISADSAKLVKPIRIFDGLYYVGTGYVSSYLIRTSDGLILVDALHDDFTEQSLRQIGELGFDVGDIRYLIVSHGHRDHVGGATAVLRASPNARVAMSAEDWKIARDQFPGLRQDMVVEDGDTLTLGDVTLRFLVTPGHTPGVTSFLFDVKDGDDVHKAFLFGGHNVTRPWPGGSDIRQPLESMVSSTARLIRSLPSIDVNLTSHPWAALIFERAKLLENRGGGMPHPFVDPEDFRAFLGAVHGDHRARLKEIQDADR